MTRQLARHQIIERSLIKKYRKVIWTPFVSGIKRYQMIQANDRIAVCMSGGKDSMLLAKLMQQLQRHSEVPFELVFLVMDPGYNEVNRQKIIDNGALLQVPLTIFESNIFDTVSVIEKSPCYLCARMRRGFLYSKAQALGCNKIALGHHFSDVIETTLLGMFYGAQIQTMMPKLHSTNFPGMELIRPLYCVHEESIIAWQDYHQLQFLQCACRFTENCAISEDAASTSKRLETKRLLKQLRINNPQIENHIFQSLQCVNLNTMIGYKKDSIEYSFLDDYEQRRSNSGNQPDQGSNCHADEYSNSGGQQPSE